jgi:uncharacterized YccA/Bax inhibitor family protein
MRTGNPTLSASNFNSHSISLAKEMTIAGTVNKTLLLLILLSLSAAWSWHQFYTHEDITLIISYLWIGTLGGFVVALITVFVKKIAWFTSPIYALLEGLAIGCLSALFETAFPGIVIQAVVLTFGTLLCLLLAYQSGLIKVTATFKLGVVAATGAIFLIYIIDLILIFFGYTVPYIHETGIVGILFSLFCVTIAALNLVLDFDFIREAAEIGAPKYMEWYGAFALIITLVWLYLEMLELLAKIRTGE